MTSDVSVPLTLGQLRLCKNHAPAGKDDPVESKQYLGISSAVDTSHVTWTETAVAETRSHSGGELLEIAISVLPPRGIVNLDKQKDIEGFQELQRQCESFSPQPFRLPIYCRYGRKLHCDKC